MTKMEKNWREQKNLPFFFFPISIILIQQCDTLVHSSEISKHNGKRSESEYEYCIMNEKYVYIKIVVQYQVHFCTLYIFIIYARPWIVFFFFWKNIIIKEKTTEHKVGTLLYVHMYSFFQIHLIPKEYVWTWTMKIIFVLCLSVSRLHYFIFLSCFLNYYHFFVEWNCEFCVSSAHPLFCLTLYCFSPSQKKQKGQKRYRQPNLMQYFATQQDFSCKY